MLNTLKLSPAYPQPGRLSKRIIKAVDDPFFDADANARLTEYAVMESHDPIIQAAERDLAVIDEQRRQITAFLEQYRRYKTAIGETAEATAAQAAKTILRSAPVDEVMSAVCEILMARDDAMPLSDLFEALVRRGVRIGGTNPKQNLSQKLCADERLKSYGSKIGWYFADTDPPCMGGPSRMPRNSDQLRYEEGPTTGMAEPLHSNGAAVSPA